MWDFMYLIYPALPTKWEKDKICWGQRPSSLVSGYNYGQALALTIKPLLCRFLSPIGFEISGSSIGCKILQVVSEPNTSGVLALTIKLLLFCFSSLSGSSMGCKILQKFFLSKVVLNFLKHPKTQQHPDCSHHNKINLMQINTILVWTPIGVRILVCKQFVPQPWFCR